MNIYSSANLRINNAEIIFMLMNSRSFSYLSLRIYHSAHHMKWSGRIRFLIFISISFTLLLSLIYEFHALEYNFHKIRRIKMEAERFAIKMIFFPIFPEIIFISCCFFLGDKIQFFILCSKSNTLKLHAMFSCYSHHHHHSLYSLSLPFFYFFEISSTFPYTHDRYWARDERSYHEWFLLSFFSHLISCLDGKIVISLGKAVCLGISSM